MVHGRFPWFDGYVCLAPILIEFLVGDLLFDSVSLTVCLHSSYVDNDEQVHVTCSVSVFSCNAAKEADADFVDYPIFQFVPNPSDRCVIRCLRNGRDLIFGLDEDCWLHPTSIRSVRSIGGYHAKRLERIHGGIHATLTSPRHLVELSNREPPISIVEEDVMDIS